MREEGRGGGRKGGEKKGKGERREERGERRRSYGVKSHLDKYITWSYRAAYQCM